jgi:hypothetical protein
VANESFGGIQVVNTGADALTASLVLKRNGEEYVLDSSTIAAGDHGAVGAPLGFFALLPTDAGLYLRLIRSNLADTTADVVAAWSEVRNVEVVDVDLPQTVETTLLENDNADETLLFIGFTPTLILNADATPQPFSVVMSDGSDTAKLTSATATVPQGVTSAQIAVNLPAGSSLKATVAASAAVKTAFMRVLYTRTNSGPARPNQAGAF